MADVSACPGQAASTLLSHFILNPHDKLTIGATAFCLSMVAIRILGGGSAQILGITIDPDFTIGVLLILTAIHVLLLNYFLVEMSRGWQNLSFEDRKSIFDELSSSALLTRGLYDVEIRASDDWLFFKADMRSPYGTLYLMLYFLFALACLEVTSSIMLPTSLTVGLAIASFNWRIASSWILVLQLHFMRVFFDEPSPLGPDAIGARMTMPG